MANNKIIYGGKTLIDLTGDTITPADLLVGKKAHDKTGAIIEGTCTYDADTSDATAAASEILKGKTAFVGGTRVTGSMTNNGAIAKSITTKAQTVTVPIGYHDGSGIVQIDATEQEKIIAGNIKEGVELLGVKGSLKPSSSVTAQSKTVTPSTSVQTILPDAGTDYLSQVTVASIPYVETANTAGGTTITIAG